MSLKNKLKGMKNSLFTRTHFIGDYNSNPQYILFILFSLFLFFFTFFFTQCITFLFFFNKLKGVGNSLSTHIHFTMDYNSNIVIHSVFLFFSLSVLLFFFFFPFFLKIIFVNFIFLLLSWLKISLCNFFL
jgi:hypothetical protein